MEQMPIYNILKMRLNYFGKPYYFQVIFALFSDVQLINLIKLAIRADQCYMGNIVCLT